jgi:hypothetical protein
MGLSAAALATSMSCGKIAERRARRGGYAVRENRERRMAEIGRSRQDIGKGEG